MPPIKPKPLPSRTCTLRLSDLTRDARLRYREPVYSALSPVEDYAAVMRGDTDAPDYRGPTWDQFPRITCLDLTEPFAWDEDEQPSKGQLDRPKRVRREYAAGTTLLVGGFTRCEAADLAGVTHAPAVVYSGTWQDARRLAWRENTDHGTRRSDTATQMVLFEIHLDPESAGLSTREVAAMAGCSRMTVQRYRESVERKADEFEEAARRAERFAAANRSEPPPPPPPPPPVVVPPAATPTPTHEGAGIVPVDAWRRPLPPGLVAAFEALGPLGKLLRGLRADAKAMVQMKHGADAKEKCVSPGLVKADVMGVLAAVTAACDAVEADVPFLVCPDCDGSAKVAGTGRGCKLCGGLGWVTKGQADTFTPAQEKAAGRFRGTN